MMKTKTPTTDYPKICIVCRNNVQSQVISKWCKSTLLPGESELYGTVSQVGFIHTNEIEDTGSNFKRFSTNPKSDYTAVSFVEFINTIDCLGNKIDVTLKESHDRLHLQISKGGIFNRDKFRFYNGDDLRMIVDYYSKTMELRGTDNLRKPLENSIVCGTKEIDLWTYSRLSISELRTVCDIYDYYRNKNADQEFDGQKLF